jgi:hypothetical protein
MKRCMLIDDLFVDTMSMTMTDNASRNHERNPIITRGHSETAYTYSEVKRNLGIS